MMEKNHVENYSTYLKLLKSRFATMDKMPSKEKILSFISDYHLDEDWEINITDVQKDITQKILKNKKKTYSVPKRKKIYSYDQYLKTLKEGFDIPQTMPKDSDIQAFIEKYYLGKMWKIVVDDVKEDLQNIIDGHYSDMLSEKTTKKTVETKPYVSKTEFQTSNSGVSKGTNTYSSGIYSDYKPANKTIKEKKNPKSKPEVKNLNKQTEKGKEIEHTIFIDGDNHFDEGKKGIGNVSKNTKVRAVFSQIGAQRKFNRKYGNRPNVSSKLVPPGDQAVDNQIKAEAGRLLNKGNQYIGIVSQDKGFGKFAKKKNKNELGNHLSTAKSVKEILNKRK